MDFFELFEHAKSRLYFQDIDNISSLDKISATIGVYNNSRVVNSTTKRKGYVQAPEIQGWISIINCVSAISAKLSPVIIVKDQNLQSR